MGIIQKIQAKSLNKSYQRFTKQYDYAGKILYATFADTIDEQTEPGTQDNERDKLLLKQAVAELLGSPNGYDEEFTVAEKALLRKSRAAIEQFKSEIMNSQEEIREYVVQTARMLFLYDMMMLNGEKETSSFLKSLEGTALQAVLNEYGADYPQPTPSDYDKICESVAHKTGSYPFYKEILASK